MSVSDGQAVNAAISNAAWMSRNSDTDTTGIVSLNSAAPASGAAIANLQAAVNAAGGTTPDTSVSTQTVTTTISIGSQATTHLFRVDITGSGTLNNAPFGVVNTNFIDGMRIHVRGISGTNTVGLVHSDIQYGCILNGNITLNDYDILTLIYDSTSERFIEVSRNV